MRRLLLFQVVMLFHQSYSLPDTAYGQPNLWGGGVAAYDERDGVQRRRYGGGLLIALWGGFRNRMCTTLVAGLTYGLLMLGLGLAPSFGLYLAFNCLIGITMPCYLSLIHICKKLSRRRHNFHGGTSFRIVEAPEALAVSSHGYTSCAGE